MYIQCVQCVNTHVCSLCMHICGACAYTCVQCVHTYCVQCVHTCVCARVICILCVYVCRKSVQSVYAMYAHVRMYSIKCILIVCTIYIYRLGKYHITYIYIYYSLTVCN